MNMGLRLGFSLSQEQRCRYCTGTVSDHVEGCPGGNVAAAAQRVQHLRCPVCSAKQVDLNNDDFYECRGCHTQFTTSCIVPDGDEKTAPRHTIIDFEKDTHFDVLQLPTPGKGLIKADISLAKAMAAKKAAVPLKRSRR